jgi:hypothetical protein
MLKPFETHSRRDATACSVFAVRAFAAFPAGPGPLTLSLSLPAVALSLMSLGDAAARARRCQPARRAAAFGLRRRCSRARMAFAGFLAVPAPARADVGPAGNSVGRMGLGDRMTPNEWLDALVDDSAALRGTFPGRTPPREQMYWRGPVLVNFDGEAWVPRSLPAARRCRRRAGPGLHFIATEVMLENHERYDFRCSTCRGRKRPRRPPQRRGCRGQRRGAQHWCATKGVFWPGLALRPCKLSPAARGRRCACPRPRSALDRAGRQVAAGKRPGPRR